MDCSDNIVIRRVLETVNSILHATRRLVCVTGVVQLGGVVINVMKVKYLVIISFCYFSCNFTKRCLETMFPETVTIRWFRDRRSPVMEVILVLTHSRWWDKVNIPYMEYVVYICFRMSFAYFACQ